MEIISPKPQEAVLHGGGEVPEHREPARHGLDLVEEGGACGPHAAASARQKGLHQRPVVFPERRERRRRFPGAPLGSGPANFRQGVGRLPHGREDEDGRRGHTTADDLHDLADVGGVSHRGAAELEDSHGVHLFLPAPWRDWGFNTS